MDFPKQMYHFRLHKGAGPMTVGLGGWGHDVTDTEWQMARDIKAHG